jgi:hypothetical protein
MLFHIRMVYNVRRVWGGNIAKAREDIGKWEKDEYGDTMVPWQVRPCCRNKENRAASYETEKEYLWEVSEVPQIARVHGRTSTVGCFS